MSNIEDQLLSQSVYAEAQRMFRQQGPSNQTIDAILEAYKGLGHGPYAIQQPVTATAQESADDVRKAMARQIEVLSDRLNVEHERRNFWKDAANKNLDMLVDARKEIAALRAKLPPDPPSPPTAGETLAHCKRAIFPLER